MAHCLQGHLGMWKPEPAFVPPHCPRTSCPHHTCTVGWICVRHGTYVRDCEPRVIQRYLCCRCGATFSSQTFSTTYYLKRPDLPEPLFHRLVACSAYRQIARELKCAHSTLVRQAARLGRHCLLLMVEARGRLARVLEPLVIDGFESFALSQYHPLHLHLVVGAKSHFIYGFTHSRLRRKGRMTPLQHRRRGLIEAEHGRPDPKAVERDMAAALGIAAPHPQALVVHSDEHPAYPRSLRHLHGYAITHVCTPSVLSRTSRNPLFPVNRADLLLRHSGSHHKRETIAFAKRHQAVVERAALQFVWCNFSKALSENRDPETPAMKLGLEQTPLGPAALLARRRFVSHTGLPEAWWGYYLRRIDTPGIANPTRHSLRMAF